MGFTGTVESGQREFLLQHSTATSHVKGGYQKKKKKVQHVKKTRIPKSSGKVRILKGGKEEP